MALDVEDLDGPTSSLWVSGKGRREKLRLDLPDATVRLLGAWIEVRGSEPGPLFVRLDRAAATPSGVFGESERLSDRSVYNVVSSLGAEAGLTSPVRPHGLRHSAVTQVWDKLGPAAATEFARHADPRVTMRYVDRHNGRRDAARMLASEGGD